jgi:hypothetical protein
MQENITKHVLPWIFEKIQNQIPFRSYNYLDRDQIAISFSLNIYINFILMVDMLHNNRSNYSPQKKHLLPVKGKNDLLQLSFTSKKRWFRTPHLLNGLQLLLEKTVVQPIRF